MMGEKGWIWVSPFFCDFTALFTVLRFVMNRIKVQYSRGFVVRSTHRKWKSVFITFISFHLSLLDFFVPVLTMNRMIYSVIFIPV